MCLPVIRALFGVCYRKNYHVIRNSVGGSVNASRSAVIPGRRRGGGGGGRGGLGLCSALRLNAHPVSLLSRSGL